MAEPEVKSREKRQGQMRREGLIHHILSAVFILLWGWLTSIDTVAWLQPFLLVGAIVFATIGTALLVMWNMLRYGFKQ